METINLYGVTYEILKEESPHEKLTHINKKSLYLARPKGKKLYYAVVKVSGFVTKPHTIFNITRSDLK